MATFRACIPLSSLLTVRVARLVESFLQGLEVKIFRGRGVPFQMTSSGRTHTPTPTEYSMV